MVMGSRDLFRGLTNELGMPYSRDPLRKILLFRVDIGS